MLTVQITHRLKSQSKTLMIKIRNKTVVVVIGGVDREKHCNSGVEWERSGVNGPCHIEALAWAFGRHLVDSATE